MSWELMRGGRVVRSWDRYTKRRAVYWFASKVAKPGDEIRFDGRTVAVFSERDQAPA